jgi:hypothetical protein
MTLTNMRRRSAVGLAVLAWTVVMAGCGPEAPVGESDSGLGAEPGTVEWCEARGGRVYGDPGDGSIHRAGCPDGRQYLGSVSFGIEGGICCK